MDAARGLKMLKKEQLLDQLYRIAGMLTDRPDPASYALVAKSMFDSDAEVREHAIFIGALRWSDPVMLSCITGVLTLGSEPVDDNRRLMIESVVSAALRGKLERAAIEAWLRVILKQGSTVSLQAKAAYAGILRLQGKMSIAEAAALDYETFVVDQQSIA